MREFRFFVPLFCSVLCLCMLCVSCVSKKKKVVEHRDSFSQVAARVWTDTDQAVMDKTKKGRAKDVAFTKELAYTLVPGDALKVQLRGIPDEDGIEDIIDQDGYITLPFIDEILAAGKTSTRHPH